MSRRLIIRPEAEAEMADAFDWYEDRVPGLGSDFLLSVEAVFNAILDPRGRGSQTPHLNTLPGTNVLLAPVVAKIILSCITFCRLVL